MYFSRILKNEYLIVLRDTHRASLGDSAVKNPPANTGDSGLIPGSEGSQGKGNGSPLQYSCLDRGAWQATSPWGCQKVGHYLATQHQQRHTCSAFIADIFWFSSSAHGGLSHPFSAVYYPIVWMHCALLTGLWRFLGFCYYKP